MFKSVNSNAPDYLVSTLPQLVGARTVYGLRNREDLDPIRTRINLYANSFFPRTVKDWNDLDRARRILPSIEAFKANYRRRLPQKNPLYYFGGRLESAIHARLRIKNSPLKNDLCTGLHVIESPLCPCGSGEIEDAKHFFFKCSLYDNERVDLVRNRLPFAFRERDYQHLVEGIPNADHPTNIHIYSAVHTFIRDTKRFY
jgi:hypothetical protein